MWVEKYRPEKIVDIVAHRDIIDTIQHMMKYLNLPHLLFYGPPGTGKTSTILAVAKEIYGTSFSEMTLELNASDERGIDVVREQIKSFASTSTFGYTRSMHPTFKLVILDECDNMTQIAQFALCRIIEMYSEGTRFCLIGNFVGNIIPALQSRCTQFRFAPLDYTSVRQRISHVVDAEAINITSDAIDAVQYLGGGDMRRTINILQASWLAKLGNDVIQTDDIYLTTGQPRPQEVDAILGYLLKFSFREAVYNIERIIKQKCLALSDIICLMCQKVFELPISQQVRCDLINEMSNIEYRLAFVKNDKLQLFNLVGIFNEARKDI
jgi:replication factor C subunit 3/5